MISIRKAVLPAMLWSAVCLAASPADAGKGTKIPNPNAAIVSQLRTTVGVLKQADHDYQGHRVKAIQQIRIAVKALAPGKHRHGKIASGSGKLPQNVSDGLLHKAIQQLNVVQMALANSSGPGNRAAAMMAVQAAIAELRTALKIR
jgi:hypothetical protein